MLFCTGAADGDYFVDPTKHQQQSHHGHLRYLEESDIIEAFSHESPPPTGGALASVPLPGGGPYPFAADAVAMVPRESTVPVDREKELTRHNHRFGEITLFFFLCLFCFFCFSFVEFFPSAAE